MRTESYKNFVLSRTWDSGSKLNPCRRRRLFQFYISKKFYIAYIWFPKELHIIFPLTRSPHSVWFSDLRVVKINTAFESFWSNAIFVIRFCNVKRFVMYLDVISFSSTSRHWCARMIDDIAFTTRRQCLWLKWCVTIKSRFHSDTELFECYWDELKSFDCGMKWQTLRFVLQKGQGNANIFAPNIRVFHKVLFFLLRFKRL